MPDEPKKTQAEVNLRQGERPQVCMACENYQRPPVFGCEKVDGRIVPGKVCDLFAPTNASSSPSD